jgi:hypothetical protein
MVLLQINILSDLSLIIKIGLVGGVKLACNFFTYMIIYAYRNSLAAVTALGGPSGQGGIDRGRGMVLGYKYR